jgi:hypothetical protein
MVFWYLKILSKPNGILSISSGRNDGAETLSFQCDFNDFCTFPPFPSKLQLFLQGIFNGFWYLKIPSKPNGILGISSGRNDSAETLSLQSEFQWF